MEINMNALWITMFAPHLIPVDPEPEMDDVTQATEAAIDADWRAYDDHEYNVAGECYREELPEWLHSVDY